PPSPGVSCGVLVRLSPRAPPREFGAALSGGGRRVHSLLPAAPRSANPSRPPGRAAAGVISRLRFRVDPPPIWHAAKWAPGTLGLIGEGVGRARAPDSVIAEPRCREFEGLIELAPPAPLRRGVRVRILRLSPGIWPSSPT